MSIRLRLMTTQDIPAGMGLKDIAQWNQTSVDWEGLLSASPQGCFVAEDDHRVIGTSATIVYESRFAWIGMLLVDPEYRGRGIGTALLERAMGYLDSQNVLTAKLDATPQGKLLYSKLGFVSEYEVERWMLKRQPGEKAVRQVSVAIEDVRLLDREIFGADRSELLHSMDKEEPEFTQVTRQGEHVSGYVFGRRGSLADQIGPWMATSEDVAAALLDEFLRRLDRELVFVDCMCGNQWALPLVKARGFEFSRSLTRMFRGRNDYPGHPELLCAIVGPEFG